MSILDKYNEASAHLNILGTIVYRDGTEVARHHREKEMRLDQYSVSKSFLSTAAGLAIEEGLITLEDKVAEVLSDRLPENPKQALLDLNLSHLLKMSMGQKSVGMMANQRSVLKERDWASHSLAKPFTHAPGTRFMYSNTPYYIAALMLQRKTGCDLIEYLMPRLFDPLDTLRPTWEVDPEGNSFGASGLFMTLSDVAKIGLLYLQDGLWEGRRILPAGWVALATSPQIETGRQTGYESEYGYGFWLSHPDSFRAQALLGQFVIAFRDKNAVIAINSREPRDMDVLACAMEHIYPEL